MTPENEGQNNLTHKIDTRIFVFYVSTLGKTSEQVRDSCNMIRKTFDVSILGEESICILIPTEGHTRLECINPQYISDKELIAKHTALLQDVYENLKLNIEKANNG